MWSVVKETSTTLWLVILVRCMATGRFLAYCRDCGASWLSPMDLRVNDFAIGSELFREASKSRAVKNPRSNWADSVREFIPQSEF